MRPYVLVLIEQIAKSEVNFTLVWLLVHSTAGALSSGYYGKQGQFHAKKKQNKRNDYI